MKVRKALGATVEGGRISEEDAAKRYEGAEKAIRETMAAGRSECVGEIDRTQLAQPRSPIRVIRSSARDGRLSRPLQFSLSAPGLTVLSHELNLLR